MENRDAGQASKESAVRGAEGSEKSAGLERSSAATSKPERRPSGLGGPFSLMRRMSEDMERFFDDLVGRRPGAWLDLETHWPQIEVHQRGPKLVVIADLPGMTKDELTVEVRDQTLFVSGERRDKSERRSGGYCRSERTYGSFCRAIPLPPGAKADTAAASFENGVLEIEIEVPEGANGTRRVEIREQPSH